MFSFNMTCKFLGTLSLNVTCPGQELSFWGTTRELGAKDFCLAVPTTRIKTTFSQILNENVTIACENVLLEGNVSWYTIEGDYYLIGISIGKAHRSAWKNLLSEKSKVSLHAEVRHVSP